MKTCRSRILNSVDSTLGLEHARKALAAQPDYLWGHLDAAMNAVRLGRVDEARAAIAEARRIQPNSRWNRYDRRLA